MILEVGQGASISKTISETDVYSFAGIVGDFNGVHVNAIAAKNSIFKQRVAHGMLVGSFISSVLGTKFPGEGTVYMEQKLEFKRPVYFDDTITASVTVEEVINQEKGIYKLDTQVTNQIGDTVIKGYAVVKYLPEEE